MGGRAPPGQNMRTLCARSRWPASARAPRVPTQTVLNSAVSIRQLAIDLPLEEINFNVDSFVAQEYQSRRQTFEALRQTRAEQSIEQYLDQLPEQWSAATGTDLSETTLSTIRNIVAAIEDEGLEVLPEADSIEPTEIPSLPPETDSDDSNLKVLVDILAEGFGFGEPSLLIAFVEGNSQLRSALTDLAQIVSTKDWEAAAEALETLLSGAMMQDFINEVLRKLSKRAKRRFLHALAVRALPFVGWLYTIASLIVAFKSNYHRFSIA